MNTNNKTPAIIKSKIVQLISSVKFIPKNGIVKIIIVIITLLKALFIKVGIMYNFKKFKIDSKNR